MRAVLRLLDRGVRRRLLPCYFRQDLNVLRDLTERRLAQLGGDLSFFRDNLADPLRAVLTAAKPDLFHARSSVALV